MFKVALKTSQTGDNQFTTTNIENVPFSDLIEEIRILQFEFEHCDVNKSKNFTRLFSNTGQSTTGNSVTFTDVIQ